MPESPRSSRRLFEPRLVLPIVALALTGLLAWLWFGWQPDPSSSTPRGGPFTLQSAAGPVSLADFRGKLVLLYFGYTACPDVCPTNLSRLAAALRSLTPQEQAKVQVLFVSVDPARDDPAHLAQYARYFYPGFIGLTGEPNELRDIAGRYGAVYRRSDDSGSAMGYLIDHSAMTYLIDQHGQLSDQLPHASSAEQIASLIRAHLAHSANVTGSRHSDGKTGH